MSIKIGYSSDPKHGMSAPYREDGSFILLMLTNLRNQKLFIMYLT